MYKAIIFDIDNTLLDYSSSELFSMQQTMKEHGFYEQEQFKWDHFWDSFSPINMMYWNERNNMKINIQQVLEYSFRDTLKYLKSEHSISKSMALTYWELFCNTCHFERGATDLLAHLHGGYKLSVISNGIGEAQRKRLLTGEIKHYFDSLIISDEVGQWKPDKAIFDTALASLNVDASEVLFIGDSITDDYEGASKAKIDFCFYNKYKQTLAPQIKPTFVIDQLLDIKHVIHTLKSQ